MSTPLKIKIIHQMKMKMTSKTYIPDETNAPRSQIGASLDALSATIQARMDAGDSSYTHRLLEGRLDNLLKKVSEEALEVGLAAKEAQMLDAYSSKDDLYDAAVDHLRYEAADEIYHLMVLLARFGIPTDELAAELNNRMTEDERPQGAIRLKDDHVKRGK